MSPAKEKDIKDRLTKVWEKEMIRVQHIPNGWLEKRVTFGKCTVKIQGTESLQKMLDTLEDFGIDMNTLKKMEPDYHLIFEIYEAVRVYRLAVRYLRELKEHMSTFDNFKWWENN